MLTYSQKIKEFKRIIDEYEMSLERVARICKVGYSTVWRWYVGKGNPNENLLDFALENLKKEVEK